MLTKLNGVPWEDVKVQESDSLPSISNEYFNGLRHCINDPDTGFFCPLQNAVDTVDRVNYFVMSKTAITEHAYKASAWAVGKTIHFLTDWMY